MLVTENEGSQWDERVGKEERGMHARVSKLEGPPEQVNELGHIVAEWVAPSIGFGVRWTTSTLKPNSCSAHSLPLPW